MAQYMSYFGALLVLALRYMEENRSSAILATRRSAGVTSEMNLREGVRHMPLPSVNKAAHSWL